MKRWFFVGVITTATGAAVTMLACGSDEAGTDITAAASDASSDGASSSSSSSGSSGSSGGPRPANEAGVTADGGIDPPNAGPGGDTKSITCGTATCPIPAETCCVSESNVGDNSYACVVGATCPQPPGGGDTAALKCSAASNCAPGTVCCVREDNGNAASECKPACGQNEAQLCDLKAGDAGGCPPADPCSNDNIDEWGKLPESYATCAGKGR